MQQVIFPCNKWLAKNKDDNEIARDLFPLDTNSGRGSRQSVRSRESFGSRDHTKSPKHK